MEAAPRLWLGAIVLVALACRLAGVGDRLVLDEGYSWLVGSAPSAHAFLDRLASFENTPPLYYLLLAPVHLGDEVWIRWPALVAGVATVPLVYAIVRPLAGTKAALLGALALAVAPYQVATANLARGFMPATLGLLLAVWGAVRLTTDEDRRWWWVYLVGATIAIWSEYYAALTLVPLLVALLVLRPRPVRETLLVGIAPALTMIPWAWQLKRSLDLDGVTKVIPASHGTSPSVIRDEIAPLFFGEHGDSAAARSLELLVLLSAIGIAVWLLRRNKPLLWLVGAVAAGTVIAHAVAAHTGKGVFERRYLSVLVPLTVALLAPALLELRRRWLVRVAVAALLFVGADVFSQRYGRELEPNYAGVARVVAAQRVSVVLTNSPVVEYYLRGSENVRLDRPFNLGGGSEPAATPPYAVVDDSEVGDGPRRGPGAVIEAGRIVVRVVRSR